MVTEADVDLAARRTIVILDRMLEAVEVREPQTPKPSIRVLRPLCTQVELDFISYDFGNRKVAISRDTPRKWFGLQLAICDSCGLKDPCLERALETGSEFGIWGGLMPSERRTLRETA